MKNKKLNKIKVSIVLIIILFLLMQITGFGRFVYNNLKDRFLTSKEFYFTSNLLDVNTKTHRYNNWSGADVYKLDLELYSFENELLRVDYDYDYSISCTTTSTKITCKLGSQTGSNTQTGTIYAKKDEMPYNKEVVSIYLIPNDNAEFDLGETITIKVTAYTSTPTAPYSKTISANFEFEITAQGADYQIEDKENQTYALVKLKNTLAIDSNVTLRFDPTVVRLDMNDEVYLNNISYKTEEIDDSEYVNEITFLMPKESSKNIKFYKIDKTENYTNQLDIFEIIKTDSSVATP